MRLVQQRLDRLNLGATVMESDRQKFREDCISHEIQEEDKIELVNKLAELEAKKKQMDTMIQRVKNSQQKYRSNADIDNRTEEHHNTEIASSQRQTDARSSRAKIKKNVKVYLPPEHKPNVGSTDGELSEEVWSSVSGVNCQSPNVVQIASPMASPTCPTCATSSTPRAGVTTIDNSTIRNSTIWNSQRLLVHKYCDP